jgi:hypothetical protein
MFKKSRKISPPMIDLGRNAPEQTTAGSAATHEQDAD